MKANHLHRIFKSILCACVTIVCASSCVYIDDHLGENFIPTNQQYDVYTMAFPLKNISMAYADSLSGFSSTRFTVGSIRDPETGGLTSRSSAFTLVPLNEEMDFGENPQVIQFHFTAVKDTVSCIAEDEERILQNIRVYEVKKDLGSKYIYTSSGYRMEDDGIIGDKEISAPIIYNGGDSLSFDFTKEFSQDFIMALADKFADIEDIDGYNEAFPEPLDPGFRDKIEGEGVKDKNLGLLDLPSYENLCRFVMHYADGVVAASPDVDPKVIEWARKSEKPILEYQNPEADDFFDNYNRFYEAIQ